MPSEPPVQLTWYPEAPGPEPMVFAIGTFDGVHLGHQAILRACAELAAQLGARPAAVTFEPHPRHVLQPASAPPILTPLRLRLSLLRQHGAEAVAVITFDRALAALDPETFVRGVLQDRLQARGAVVGFNFGFGKDRRGDARLLQELGERTGLVVRVVPPAERAGQVISSSAVRRMLEEGQVREAAELLGRPYRLEGTVVRGEGRGRKLGYPTANVATDPLQLLPADGVYTALLDGMPALAVVSRRPTFGEQQRWLEVHVLEGRWELYGRTVSVDLLEWLRPIVRFERVEALVAQIEADRRAAAEYFSTGLTRPPLQQARQL